MENEPTPTDITNERRKGRVDLMTRLFLFKVKDCFQIINLGLVVTP